MARPTIITGNRLPESVTRQCAFCKNALRFERSVSTLELIQEDASVQRKITISLLGDSGRRRIVTNVQY